MIITEKLIIKNVAYYKSKGYISDSDGFIEVSIDNLSKCSHQEVLVKCDFCGFEKKVTYKYYNNNLKNGNMFSCSNKCGKNKAKITNLEKFGVEYPSQNKDIKEKVKQTNLERYGSEYGFQNKEIKEKIKKTNLERYGVEYLHQNDKIKEKVKQTNLERYGVEHYNNLEKIKETNLKKYGVEHYNNLEKIKETNLKKYGVEFTFQSEEIKEKVKQFNLDKYGFENPFQNEDIKEKIKLTNLKKYGVDNYNKSEKSKKTKIIGTHPNYIRYINKEISLFKCDLNKEHKFEINSGNFLDRLRQNLPICTICYPIGDNKSIKEKILLEYIKSIYSREIISGYRDGLEIDIFLPKIKIGIEFNGLYWHSNKFKENNYHINKLEYFKGKDIDIKFIYEDDFDNKLDIIKSQINNWLGLSKIKIYARKTVIKQILNTEEYRDFLNKNHIQGFVPSKLIYGLYYNNDLVSLMCFDKKEGRLNMPDGEWNLNRFCNLLNHQVVGGASKLLNHFIKENYPSRIISYADKDWSNGNLYFSLGFNLVSESKPDYKYIVDNVRKSKQNFTKSKLAKLGHDISLTESQIMENLGINKIYDCGKMKFEKKLGL